WRKRSPHRLCRRRLRWLTSRFEAPPVVEEEVPSPPAEEPVAVEHDVEDPAVEAPVEDVVPAAVEAEAPSDDATPVEEAELKEEAGEAVQESVVDEEEPAPETTRDVATEVPVTTQPLEVSASAEDLEEPVPAVDVAPAEESVEPEAAQAEDTEAQPTPSRRQHFLPLPSSPPRKSHRPRPQMRFRKSSSRIQSQTTSMSMMLSMSTSMLLLPLTICPCKSGAEDAEVPVIADDGTSEPAVAAEDEAVVESTQVDDNIPAPIVQLIPESSPDAGDDLVDLPSVPIVSSEPVLPANAPAVPDVSDLPATPSIDVPASSDDAVPEEAADMPPAPESVVVSGSTPGPTLAFSTSEPVAAVEAAKDKETEESGN
ncbi:hypothetical protein BD626DRAFT_148333, partial [Schizophyllum amplum]